MYLVVSHQQDCEVVLKFQHPYLENSFTKKSNSNYNCNKAKSNNDNEWGQRKLGLTKYTNHRIYKGYKVKENTAQLKLKSLADT